MNAPLQVTAATAVRFGADAPMFAGKVQRPALLFVAGHYPDKGLTLTGNDLDRIIARFEAAGASRSVPVITDHVPGLHDPLGACVALHRDGDALWGMLTFSEATDAHLRERGIFRCSVGLSEPDGDGSGWALREVSMTEFPRVPQAGIVPPPPGPLLSAKLAAFRASGKVTPAMEGPLFRLLSLAEPGAVVTFSDGSASVVAAATLDVAAEVEALLTALPVVLPRGALVSPTAVRFAASDLSSSFSATVQRVADRLGVDPARVQTALSSGQ